MYLPLVAWGQSLTVGLSFLGGLLGAGIPALVTMRGQRQDARAEWRQRLDLALGLITSADAEKRQIGEELLAHLLNSDLGSRADRELAWRIARIRVLSTNPGSPRVQE